MISQLIDELQLIKILVSLRKGDQDAMEKLYQTVGPFLHRFALTIVHSEALSEEVLQESFIKIWHHCDSFDPKRGKVLTWLRAIVRNKAIDKLRAESKHIRDRHIDNNYALDDIESESIYQPEIALSHAQTSRFLDAQFKSLPTDQHFSIRLTYLHGYSRLELAEAMDTNINTTKSWLRRGLNTIKKQNIKSRVTS